MVLPTTFLNSVKTNVKTKIVDEFLYVDFGTGTTPVLPSDTAMETSVVRNARQEYQTLTDDVIVSGFLGTGQANGSNISEIGVFDASSGGNIKEHALITAISKTSSKELWVDVRTTITVTQT